MNDQNEQRMKMDEKNIVPTNLIVGMGASAGGLEALQYFFGNTPSDSGLSFVVIQHLSPDYKSLLAEILSKHTSMRVVQAENAMDVLPNRVYLIPPKNKMVLRDGRLYLTESTHGSINHPIDIFFASLAEEMKERSIAVVFSGTGSDGTNGIKAIKEQGGLVIVQDPISAKFDGMPKNAINTGLADFILNPQEIAVEILNYNNYPTIIQPSESEEMFSDEEQLARIYRILKKVCGIDYTHYKRNTIIRRIERRMVVTHHDQLGSFVNLLESNEDEARLLGREILIGVTNFFRDPAYFEKLKENVILKLMESSAEMNTIRVWVAGCSTGEEAYSIAILIHETMEALRIKREVKIFATDVDTRAIEVAGKGNFSESILEDVTPERLAKYFTKKGDRYQINKDIRRMIIFAPHNMFTDPPFGKLDLISCRNVIIYFQPILQKNLFTIFHSALRDGGYLFLGKSETVNEFADVFHSLCPAEKIYIHVGEGKMPELLSSMFTTPSIHPLAPYMTNEIERQDREDKTADTIYIHLLEKFLPACVVVNSKNDIIHFFGNHGEYLTVPSGKATFNIFHMISGELSLAVSTALNHCRKERETITYADISVDSSKGRRLIDLIVQPIPSNYEAGKDLIAILFEEQKRTDVHGVTEKYNVDKTAARRIADLEGDLQNIQSDLQVTVSELETVNEELQASNEELLTANEELQSSNEELQSVNEELYTVNAEYQQKLDELTEMTNDLNNFLSSTMIGLLFVDEKMNIRKFTEYIGRDFQLLEHDIGRSMQIFAHSFPNNELETDAKTVLKTLTPIDRELTSTKGKNYTVRLAPYRTAENSIMGLVITIIDGLNQ